MKDALTTVCRASVWPHRHTDDYTGPLDLKISWRNQPPVIRAWPKKRPADIHLEQPDERTNLTVMKLSFGADLYPSHRINQYRLRRDDTLTCYIKGRITNQMEHPIPRGRWEGTCEYTDKWCLFTFQALTLQVKQPEPLIVLPDGSLPETGKSGKPGKPRIIVP